MIKVTVSQDSDYVEVSDDEDRKKPIIRVKVHHAYELIGVLEEVMNALYGQKFWSLCKIDEGREVTVEEW